MVTVEGQPDSFDANGNTVSINTTNLLSYDFENRLTQTVFAEVTNSFQYDGAGNRVAANRGGFSLNMSSTKQPLTQVLCESDSSGNINAYYVYGRGWFRD